MPRYPEGGPSSSSAETPLPRLRRLCPPNRPTNREWSLGEDSPLRAGDRRPRAHAPARSTKDTRRPGPPAPFGWLGFTLWRNGELRADFDFAWRALLNLDGIHWFIGLAIGAVCGVFMLWVWAELMRRTGYLSEEELNEMKTKWVG